MISVMFKFKNLVLIACILIYSCHMSTTPNTQDKPMTNSDVHSFAKPAEAVVTHIHLNLNVDFENHILKGFAKINFKNITGTNQLILDTRDLKVSKITQYYYGYRVL